MGSARQYMSEITWMQNWLCPGDMPPSMKLHAQKAACEGIHGIWVARFLLCNRDTYYFLLAQCRCARHISDHMDHGSTVTMSYIEFTHNHLWLESATYSLTNYGQLWVVSPLCDLQLILAITNLFGLSMKWQGSTLYMFGLMNVEYQLIDIFI